jgi:hypothetical protein
MTEASSPAVVIFPDWDCVNGITKTEGYHKTATWDTSLLLPILCASCNSYAKSVSIPIPSSSPRFSLTLTLQHGAELQEGLTVRIALHDYLSSDDATLTRRECSAIDSVAHVLG